MDEEDILITIDDVRRYHCASGIRRWFELHDLDFRDFTRNGIRASSLLATEDAMAERVVRLTQENRSG